jgi:hypothetical protein
MEKGMDIDIVSLRMGAEDFRYLLGRGYPRGNSLDLVGNRYSLRKDERDLLHRGVFAPDVAAARREKLLELEEIGGYRLGVDGYNVLITVEAALCQKPLVVADDGFIRDISGISSAHRMRDLTLQVVDFVLEVLSDASPKEVVFLFDSPISKSGDLARHVADRLKAVGLLGESRAVKVPERTLIGYDGVVSTSDSAIVDQVEKAIDLAGHVIRNRVANPWLIEL